MALEFEFVDEGLVEALRNLPENAVIAVRETVKKTTKRAQQIAKFKTPVDTTKAINGWGTRFENNGERGIFFNAVPYITVLEFGGYPVVSTKKRTKRATKKKAKKKTKKKVRKRNKPKRERTGPGLVRGDARLGGFPPGLRTQIAVGGTPAMRSNVSKQAPRGMVRSTLEEIEPQFIFDLREALDRAFV